MTEHAPDRVWSGIDIPKTLAGALAAVCAAVIGSFLGVAGTLIGAAVASIIGSVGTEIWHRSIRKGTQHIQTTLVPAFVKAPAAVGTPEVAAASEEDSPSHVTAPATGEQPTRRQLRWKPILIGAALLFFISMGAILAVESLAGQSIASITGNGTKGGNTLSHLISGDTTTNPTPTPTVTETPASTAPTAGNGSDSGDAPSTAPSAGATAPTTAPTTGAPATDAPQETTPADGGAVQEQATPGGGEGAQQ